MVLQINCVFKCYSNCVRKIVRYLLFCILLAGSVGLRGIFGSLWTGKCRFIRSISMRRLTKLDGSWRIIVISCVTNLLGTPKMTLETDLFVPGAALCIQNRRVNSTRKCISWSWMLFPCNWSSWQYVWCAAR